MKDKADIERYLLEMEMPFEELDDGIWLLNDKNDNLENMLISWAPPIVIFRVKLMDLPEGDNTGLMHKLLQLNATDMVSGAYGIEDNSVVAIDTLQAENMDLNEFKASIESIALSIREHYPVLSAFRRGHRQ